MTHHPDQTYSLTDLRSHCVGHGYLAEAERLDLYLALQGEQDMSAEGLAIHVEHAPSFLALLARRWSRTLLRR